MSENKFVDMAARDWEDAETAVAPPAEVPEVPAPVEKPYKFRQLSSVDMFLMFKIIGKIGVNEFTVCFEKDGIQKLIASMTGNDDKDNIASVIGVSVVLEIANVIFGNLPKCEAEIFQMLSNTSNLSIDEVKKLDFATFAEMIIDFIKKDEFRDFIKVVSKLFK